MKRTRLFPKPFHQLDQSFWMDLTSLTILAADLMWVSLYYFCLTNPPAGWIKASIFLSGVIFGSNLLSRLLGATRIKGWLQRIVISFCLLTLLFVSFRVLFFFDQGFTAYNIFIHPFKELALNQNSWSLYWHFVIVLLLFWRGGSLNAKSLELFSANSSFQLGILMYIIFGFGFGWTLYAQPTFNFILFLFFSVLGMGASRLIGIGILRAGKSNKVSSAWPTWLLIASILIVLMSVSIGILTNHLLAQAITFLFVIFMFLLSVLFFIILYPVIWLAQQIVALIRMLLNSTGQGADLLEKFRDLIGQIPQGENNGDFLIRFTKTIQPWVIGLIVLILFGLIALGISAVRRQKNKRIKLLSSDVDLPLTPRQRKQGKRLGLLERLRKARRYWAAERIRRIYARLMDLCQALENPRPESFTPLEFLPAACDLIPDVSSELKRITESYNKIRYGELPEDPEEVGIIESDWKKVHAQGSRLILILKKQKRKKESESS